MKYRDLIGGTPWTIRLHWRGHEVFYWWVPLRVSIGGQMGLWIRCGHCAQYQFGIRRWAWQWEPRYRWYWLGWFHYWNARPR